MTINDLIETLNEISKEYGNLNVQIMIDPLQKKVLNEAPFSKIDEINLVKIGTNNSVILSNEYITQLSYKGIPADIKYDTNLKLYIGKLNTEEIGDFNATFTCSEKDQIEAALMNIVDEYLDFMDNAIISKTNETINNIKADNGLNDSDSDLDYGEV